MLRHAIAPVSAYTKAAHSVIRNRRLTSDAKILVLHVQGLPESAATAKPLGEHAVDLGMKPRAYQKAKECLAACGYLHEWRWQGDRGRWITEQLLANIPLGREEAAGVRDGDRSPTVREPMVGGPTPPEPGDSPQEEDGEKKNTPHPPTEEPPRTPSRQKENGDGSEGEDEGEAPVPPAPKSPAPESSAPEPTAAESPAPADPRLAQAEHLLLSLRREHRDLLLGVREARGLAAMAAEWLRRGITPDDLRHALTAHLPRTGVHSAVGFLRHRLTEKLPQERTEPPLGEAPRPAPGALVDCAGPGEPHAFRPLGDETHCAPCRRETARKAAPGAQPPPRPERPTWRTRVADAFAAHPDRTWSALDGPAPATS
ncbi:hypothetical protein ACFFSH_16230 [Streptomyces filamentosus]|uniref:DNA-binding protein n=1 Tax=Streptomyces filamentosus TaxID=67294 RepID=A0A919BGJ0_STRFL|nr:hypothetical protein [Streptomyces filamentosus]GHF90450.1 hypothetical protein GCM10017667_19440 [Streptomyces filamentosus]